MKILMSGVVLALSLAGSLPAAAQTTSPSGMGNMQGMGSMKGGSMKGGSMPGMPGMDSMSPMQHEQMMAMQRMSEKMMAASDANPDRAFAKKMIAHHEGAIAMSEIELRMGKDAQAKRLAQKTIAENRKGVASLQSFLSTH